MNQFTPGRVYIRKSEKGIVIDPKGFAKTLINFATGNAVEGVNELIDTFGLKESDEEKAYKLIFNNLFDAVRTIFKEEYISEINVLPSASGAITDLQIEVDNTLKELDLYIDAAFFNNPKSFPFFRQFKPYFEKWLIDFFKLTRESAFQCIRKIDVEFWKNIYEDLILNGDRYSSLLAKTRITREAELLSQFAKKRLYYGGLASYFHSPVFNNYQTRLSDLYIYPNFELKYKYKEGEEDYSVQETLPTIDFLTDKWLKGIDIVPEKDKDTNLNGDILILLGHPGQGKTSICYALLDKMVNDLDESRDIIFIKLRDLKEPIKFLQHPEQEIIEYFKEQDLQFKVENAIVILDGLDELYMVSGISKKDISNFFYKLDRELKYKENVKVIVTSRYHYIDFSEVDKKKILNIQISDLTLGQQKEWLSKYQVTNNVCNLTPEDLEKINDESNKHLKSLRELLRQPILLALVAKAKIDLNANDINRASIYDSLFNSLLNRDWDEEQLEKFKNLDLIDFRDYMGTIALKIYQSQKEYMTSFELLALEETKDFIENNIKGIDQLTQAEALEDALKEALISFYFSEVEKSKRQEVKVADRKDYAIEFYHKSLQEYLVAEKIWNTIKYSLTAKDGRKRFNISNAQDALKIFWNLLKYKEISDEVTQYLVEIIKNDTDDETKQDLFERLKLFLKGLCEVDFLLNGDTQGYGISPFAQCFNCLHVYLHLVYNIGTKEQIEFLRGEVELVKLFRHSVYSTLGKKIILPNCNLIYLFHFQILKELIYE